MHNILHTFFSIKAIFPQGKKRGGVLIYLVFYTKSNTFKSITNGNKAPYNNGFIYSNTKTTKTS